MLAWKVVEMTENTSNPLLAGLVEYLSNSSHVSDIKVQERQPANLQLLTSWEVKNNYSLPNDLRQFYLTNNGFTLDWSVTINGDLIDVGHININSVHEVCPLAIPEDISLVELDAISNSNGISFSDHDMFIISNIDCGRVCLCYQWHHGDDQKHSGNYRGIWLLDKTWTLYYLTVSFTHFFRLALCHLGLPEWPLLLSSHATISPQYQAWYHMFIPHRLKIDQQDVAVQELGVAESQFQQDINVLDVNKIFRRLHDIRLPRDKKKNVTQRGATHKH